MRLAGYLVHFTTTKNSYEAFDEETGALYWLPWSEKNRIKDQIRAQAREFLIRPNTCLDYENSTILNISESQISHSIVQSTSTNYQIHILQDDTTSIALLTYSTEPNPYTERLLIAVFHRISTASTVELRTGSQFLSFLNREMYSRASIGTVLDEVTPSNFDGVTSSSTVPMDALMYSPQLTTIDVELAETRNLMKKTLDSAIIRQETLEDLVQRIDQLEQDSVSFKKRSTHLNKWCCFLL